MKHTCAFSLLFLMLLLCACTSEQHEDERTEFIHQLNEKAYHYHYIDLDSTKYYTQKVLSQKDANESQRTEAMNHRAFVLYEEMYYDSALVVLQNIHRSSRNQIELLCADVMCMKIAQRVGEGKDFFTARHKAEQRIKRIREAESTLPSHALLRYYYALSEFYIVSSTYFYYLGQDSMAVEQMNALQPLMQASKDTAQWLYNNYMLGSGGLIMGDKEEVTVKEFDYLLRTFSVASARGYRYFRANTLQSLASMLADTTRLNYLKQDRRSELEYLLNLPICEQSSLSPALSLAYAALDDFENYGDLFQSACALRTLGEVYFQSENYAGALDNFDSALFLVEEQNDRSEQRLPQWMAGIRQQLSLTYSALGDSINAAENRLLYLSLIDSTSQNSELQSRSEQLEQELRVNHTWLYMLLVSLILCISLSLVFIYRLRKGAKLHDSQFQDVKAWPIYQQFKDNCEEKYTSLKEQLEEIEEKTCASQLNTEKLTEGHLERRAKVQMVYAIVPYLDRTIASMQRLLTQKKEDTEVLEYAEQLLEEILRIQNHLTSWIQMSRGQIKLHISSFPLSDIFAIVEGSSQTFTLKGVKLNVQPTEVHVKADRALTLFMVNTLTDNARKFTEAGGTVSLSAEQREDYVEVSVADTGIGLSQQDIQLINDTKVYDPQKIGRPDTEKGFGFGIMNCRGIIAQLRKTSTRFACCQFGCSAQEGGGTRFWFRLPYVSTMLAFLFSLQISATPIDTLSRLQELSDSAFVAQQQKDWNAYQQYNDAYIQLHHQFTADSSLPGYCARMQQLAVDNRVLYALLVLSFIFFVVLFYMMFLRAHLRDRRAWKQLQNYLNFILSGGNPKDFALSQTCLRCLQRHPKWLEAKACVELAYAEHLKHLASYEERIDLAIDEHNRQRYQEDRLYVSNQVLDNGLSTIKHETMYYPARAQQMLQKIGIDGNAETTIDELLALLKYYRHVYSLLYEQVQRQVDEVPALRQNIDIYSLFTEMAWDELQIPTCMVLGDKDELSYLVHILYGIAEDASKKVVKAMIKDAFLLTEIHYLGVEMPCIDVFSASVGETKFLIAKEIIRQHDAMCGLPGLRLFINEEKDGFFISFTLKISKRITPII